MAQRYCRATGTSSRAAEKSTAGTSDPYPLVRPDGEVIYECRPLPKILLDLMQPVPKHVPAAPSESLQIPYML
jgi:hypothetical protein